MLIAPVCRVRFESDEYSFFQEYDDESDSEADSDDSNGMRGSDRFSESLVSHNTYSGGL